MAHERIQGKRSRWAFHAQKKPPSDEPVSVSTGTHTKKSHWAKANQMKQDMLMSSSIMGSVSLYYSDDRRKHWIDKCH